MKKLWDRIRKTFAIHIVRCSDTYRYGTHCKIGYGRCYCIEKQNYIGNWITVYETDNKDDWNKTCNHFLGITTNGNRYGNSTDLHKPI